MKDPHRLARRVASDCLALRTRRLARALSRIYDDAMRPHELTVAQFTLLVAIEMAEGVQPSLLADALELEKSSLSRNLALLERRGWVRSETLVGRGRPKALSLTSAGQHKLLDAYPAWREAQRAAFERFGGELTAQLSKLGPTA